MADMAVFERLLFEGPMFNFHDYGRKGNNHTKHVF